MFISAWKCLHKTLHVKVHVRIGRSCASIHFSALICVCVGCELTNQQPVTPNQLWAVLCLQALSLSPPLPVTLCLALPPFFFFSISPSLPHHRVCVCAHVCVRGRVRPREDLALWPFRVGAMFVLPKRAEMMVNIRKIAAIISITSVPQQYSTLMHWHVQFTPSGPYCTETHFSHRLAAVYKVTNVGLIIPS